MVSIFGLFEHNNKVSVSFGAVEYFELLREGSAPWRYYYYYFFILLMFCVL
jgi:hypothetical protein